jgi:hypothetical protein
MCMSNVPSARLAAPLPQAWLDALRKVQTVCPEAIIGGGALRDHYLGATVKDVDIFVRTRNDVDSLVSSLRAATSMHFEKLDAQFAEYENQTPGLAAVLQGPGLCQNQDVCGMFCGCPPVQIIVCAGSEGDQAFMLEQLDRFDIGICKIAHNGRRVLFATDASLDMMDCRIRIANPQTDRQREQSLARVDRIAEKYPGWKIGPHEPVIPADD